MDQDEPREATPDVAEAPSDELLLALREQGMRDQAFEALPDSALLVDRQGVIADLNRRAVDLLGRSPDERVDLDDVLASDDGSPLSEAERGPLRVVARRVDGSTTIAIARAARVHVGPDTLTMYVLTDASEPFRHLEVVELEADRRRMQELERVAGQDAARLKQRMARLQAITDAALAHLSLDQLFEALLERLRELLNAEAATVLLLDPELRVLKIATTSGLPRGPEDLLDVPLGSGVAGRIATGRRPVIIGDLRRVRSVNAFIHTTLRSLVGVPIVHRGEVTGVVHVGSLRARHFTEDDITLLEIVAARLAPAIENAQLHAFERVARAEAEQDARRLRLLQQIAEELGSIRPVEAMADAVVAQVSSALETVGAAIAAVAPDARDLRLIAASGFDDATRARWASIPLDAPIPLARAVQERRAILIASTEERDASFPTLTTTPTVGRSWASLPLVVDGAAIGALGLSFREERAFDASDVELFTAIAHQAAQAIDRATRYDAERRSVQRAEAAARRLSLLQSLTARFSRALTPREVASVTVEEIATALGASSGAFFVLDEEGMLELQGSHGYRDVDLGAWRRVPADLPTPAGDALRTGELVFARSRDELLERYPSFPDHVSDRPVGATVTIPVGVDERAIGAAAFSFAADRPWHDEDLDLLRALGRHAGQALERARLFETERRARRDAELARERTERLQALAGELIDVETEAEVENLLSEHILAAAGGNASVVVRLFDDGAVRIVASRGYLRDTIERDREMDIDAASPLNDAMRSRVPVWITSREEFEERYPLLLDDWQRLGHESSFAAIPLKVAGRIVGAVGVRVAETDPWDEEDKDFLRAIARQAAQAIEQTASRRAEAQARADLELSERRNRSLIETTSTIHWTMDPAGAFVEPQASWSDYTGQTWDAYRGFGWVDAVDPDDRDALLDSWVEARDDGVVYTTEARLYHSASGEHRHVVIRAAPVRDDDGHVSEWVGTVADVHDARLEQHGRIERERAARAKLEEASERLAYLADASGVLAASLDVDQTLQRLADLAVPRLADWCAVDMREPDGSIRLVAVAHVDPKRVELAHELRRRYPPDPDDETGVPSVLRTGRPMIMPEIPEEFLDEAKRRNPELADLVDELQLRSMMTVPIAAKDRVLGAISFVWAESGHRYDEDDLALAEDLARRAAVAIENARLYEAESEARRREARARARVEVLAETGEAMARSLDPRQILDALTASTARRLTDVSVAYLVDRDGRVEDFVAAHRDPSMTSLVRRAVTSSLPDPDNATSAISRVMAGEASIVRELTDAYLGAVLTPEQRALVVRLQPASELTVPIRGRGSLLGVLTMIRSRGGNAFDDDDLSLANDLARRAGLMLDNARLYAEREEVAEILQRSLLPPVPPEIPGLDIGARYLPADQGLSVGGDFYDVFELDMDHWGAVIGDVVGKGATAAAMMGLARYTVRTAALSEGRPSTLLRTLNNAILGQASDTMFCTACFARVRRNEEGARVTLSLGGHPTPLLVRPDGTVEPFGEPGTLLGVFDDPTLTDQVIDLLPGDALVLYTDGVTDERRGDLEFGEGRLRETLASLADRGAQEMADGVVRAVDEFRSGTAHDDIALFVIRIRPTSEVP